MITEQFVETRSGTISYLESGGGWPVVLLHAFPVTHEMWRPQLDWVPDGWRFIAPDIRRLGRAARARGGTATMADYAAGIRNLLDALEIDRAIIGGLSIGGYITFELFRSGAERFTGMILADTRAGADTPEAREVRRNMLALARESGAAAVGERMLPKLVGETTRRHRPDLVEHVRRLTRVHDLIDVEDAIQAMMARPDSTPLLEKISLPVLVIVGEEDEAAPVAESETLHRHIVRSQLVVLPSAGHLSNLEAPEDFSRALTDFLGSNL